MMAGFDALAAQPIMDDIARDAAEPGAEFSGFVQIGQAFPGDDKGFLGEVLALGQAARGAVSQRANERLVAGHDLGEGVAIARQAFADQQGIGLHGTGIRFRRHHHNPAYVAEKPEKVTRSLVSRV